MGNSRQAKAQEKNQQLKQLLYDTIHGSPEPKGDYQFAFELGINERKVRDFLEEREDNIFVPLMRAKLIGVPELSNKYPKWALLHLSPTERAALPRIPKESVLPNNALVKPDTSDAVIDSNLGIIQRHVAAGARRTTARKARKIVEETNVVIGALNESISRLAFDASHAPDLREKLVKALRDSERKDKALQNAQSRINRLETIHVDEVAEQSAHKPNGLDETTK